MTVLYLETLLCLAETLSQEVLSLEDLGHQGTSARRAALAQQEGALAQQEEALAQQEWALALSLVAVDRMVGYQ